MIMKEGAQRGQMNTGERRELSGSAGMDIDLLWHSHELDQSEEI